MSRDYLVLKDGSKLRWFDKSKNSFLDKNTILFGGTNSGKSTIMEEIMYLCSKDVPVCFAISPTNDANQFFTNRLPAKFFRDGKEPAATVAFLRKILNWQTKRCYLHNIANRLDILHGICEKISNSQVQDMIEYVSKQFDNAIRKINDSNKLNIAQKKTHRFNIQQKRDDVLRKIYHSTLNKYHKEISNMQLSQEESLALKFRNINPRAMLILDDCASHFKKWFKMDTAIKEVFYQGRQLKLTTIITSQDDKDIESELRKNAMNTIFTTAQAVNENFDRASNHYSKYIKEKAKLCTEAVFRQEPNTPKHFQKLVYVNNDPDPFRFTIADLYDGVKMCAPVFWTLGQHKNKKTNILGESFLRKYAKRH